MDDKKKNGPNQIVEKDSSKDDTEKISAERDEYKARYLRALADYQNLEKRISQEKTDMDRHIQARVATKLLPVIDNLEKAEVFVKDAGLKLIKDQFTRFLSELGIKEIDILHKTYDPHQAEAIELVEGDKDNEVVEIIKKGYELNGRVIRAAQVKVSKKKP